MVPLPPSHENSYILVVIDYISKWIEALATTTNDAKIVKKFLLKNISSYGTPRALISDEGTHFINKTMTSLLKRYNLKHRIATAYHP